MAALLLRNPDQTRYTRGERRPRVPTMTGRRTLSTRRGPSGATLPSRGERLLGRHPTLLDAAGCRSPASSIQLCVTQPPPSPRPLARSHGSPARRPAMPTCRAPAGRVTPAAGKPSWGFCSPEFSEPRGRTTGAGRLGDPGDDVPASAGLPSQALLRSRPSGGQHAVSPTSTGTAVPARGAKASGTAVGRSLPQTTAPASP